MNRRFFGRFALGVAGALVAERAAAATKASHRLAMQIDSDDRRSQALMLGNTRNYAKHYRDKGETFEVSIVAFGPGYGLVRADTSMMKGELEALQKDLGGSLKILACQNTRRALAESEGKKPEDIVLLPSVDPTPSGVVALAELQEQGWAYLRP